MKKTIILNNGKKLEIVKKDGYVVVNIGEKNIVLPFDMEQAEKFIYKSGLAK